MLFALLGVCVLAVVAASVGTPWRIEHVPWEGAPERPRDPSPSLTPQAVPGTGAPTPDWVGTVLLVVVLAAFAFAVWIAYKRIPRRRLAGDTLAQNAVSGQALLGDPAPILRRGLTEAQAKLAEASDPSDAIVQAWLALEEAADRSGFPRGPADTPTEFTAVVLRSTPADATAVDELLHLYHQARFSTHGIADADRVRAQDCLHRLAASWSRVDASAP